ncbi:unnamed protein product [Anisakis simplex]|uniref:Mitochondrial carrier protein n=1 Tax=Anisakis simplex TaxID=6269 RepID=A0A0M3K9I7_ANISI|nr:unnamed protein product [Anisakis simplex]
MNDGLTSPLASLSVINAIVFGVYGNTVRLFEDKNSVLTHFIAGSASGLAQTLIATPTEMLKLRMQIQSDTSTKLYRSPYDCFRKLLKQKGIRYLFRGSIATQLRDAPAFGIYFASYEWLTRRFSRDGNQQNISNINLLIAGVDQFLNCRAFPSNAVTFFAVEWTYRLMLDLQEFHEKRLKKPQQQPNRFVASKFDRDLIILN